jgi:hypothetical protein
LGRQQRTNTAAVLPQCLVRAQRAIPHKYNNKFDLHQSLKRCRMVGQHRVVVEQVTVNEGGQAIVGNVEQGKSVRNGTRHRAADGGPKE